MPKELSRNLVKTAQELIDYTLKNPINGQQELAQALLAEDKTVVIDDILNSRFMLDSMNAFQFAAVTASLDYVLWLIDKVHTHFEALLKSAKLKMPIKNARADFFYSLIKLGLTEWHVASILYARAESLGYDFFHQIETRLQFLERSDKNVFLNQIMLAKGTTFEGYYRQAITTRLKRDYHAAREQQLLKQLATLLYFHLPEEAVAIELECMHLRIGEHSYLFVAANPAEAGPFLASLAKTSRELEQLLKKNIVVKGDTEGKLRAKRYALKMRHFVYGLHDYEDPGIHFQELAGLLRGDIAADFQCLSVLPSDDELLAYTRPCYFLINQALFYVHQGAQVSQILVPEQVDMIKAHFDLDGQQHLLTSLQHKIIRQILAAPALKNICKLNLDYAAKALTTDCKNQLEMLISQTKKQIIFLHTTKDSFSDRRHAEEFLVDVLEVARAYAIKHQLTFHAAIAGKKRPCMTCSGRMLAFNQQDSAGMTLSYSEYPGFLWLSALKAQNADAMHATLKLFLEKPSHVTASRDKLPLTDYASDTDEEQDESSVKIYR
jgi:hypothetical protein